MPKDDMAYIGHMLDTARKAVERTSGKTRKHFDSSEDLRIVLAHLVQTIGEAAARVSPETREKHGAIPWRQIVGIRHRIVHDYMDVDYDVLWEVVTNDLPALVDALSKIVPEGKK